MWQSLWREAKREMQTTVGRRRARFTSSSSDSAPPLPPVARQGIIVEESNEPDGWDVRTASPAAPGPHAAGGSRLTAAALDVHSAPVSLPSLSRCPAGAAAILPLAGVAHHAPRCHAHASPPSADR